MYMYMYIIMQVISFCMCMSRVLHSLSNTSPCMLQFMGTWVSGVREGTGEIVFPSYQFCGNFSKDQVSILSRQGNTF